MARNPSIAMDNPAAAGSRTGQNPSLTSPPTTPPSPPPRHNESPYSAQHAQIPYSEPFTNNLMRHVLSQPPPPPATSSTTSTTRSKPKPQPTLPKDDSAITILSRTSPETSTVTPSSSASTTIAISDIDISTLPTLSTDSLPLALDDPRRIYASSIPGIKLTHPGGWLEGGPGPDTPTILQQPRPPNTDKSTVNTTTNTSTHDAVESAALPPVVQAFLAEHSISTREDLHRAVTAATYAQLSKLRQRMSERRDALARNERLHREIQELQAEREMERRVRERMMRMKKEKEQEQEQEHVKDVQMTI